MMLMMVGGGKKRGLKCPKSQREEQWWGKAWVYWGQGIVRD